jgi:hypothetical protein
MFHGLQRPLTGSSAGKFMESEAAKRAGPLWRNQPPAAWEALTIPLTRCCALIGFAYEFTRFSIQQRVVGRFFLSPDEPAIEAALN